MMKTNQNNHIMNMNKGMKQKLSMLLIACLLFTGYRGLTIPGRAEQGNTEQNNAISVSGTQVKVQLLGEDLRRAAKEAIEKGERVDDSVLKGYSKDEELQKSYAGIFSLDKEVYEIPLDSISEGLSESLAEEEAGLQVFVERDAQDLDNLVRKESKESLLLYDGKSQLEQLFPKGEETESVKKEEEENLASDSNLVRNTELTGSELITFLYKNKADHRITFQLSVDGNKYPKVTVSPKTQLFKELVDKLKKEEKKVPVETTKAPESKIEESTEAKNTASEAQLAESTTSSEEVKETAKQAASKEETTEASVTEASTEDSASKVSIVSEEKKEETSEQETSEAAVKAEEKNEESAETETAAEAPVKKESTKEVEVKFSGFLQDVISHYEEFLGELVSARFSQYSLNELGRKSQNVEIEGFATVEVFYDDEAFVDEEGKAQGVVLEAKRLVKPEEEGKKDGEKLTEEQVKAMKDQAIYDDSDALDIRFVSKTDRTKEVEPKVPVSVRLTFDKEAVPEDATAEAVEVHHIVEEKNTGKVQRVETLVRAETDKTATPAIGETGSALGNAESNPAKAQGKIQENSKQDEKQTDAISNLSKQNNDESGEANKEGITKEFVVRSFSPFVVTWKQCRKEIYELRFHYVDRNFREIAPTVYVRNVKDKALGPNNNEVYYQWGVSESNSKAYKTFPNFGFEYVGGIADSEAKNYALYNANRYARWQDFHGGAKPTKITDGREAYYVDDYLFSYIDTDASNPQSWEQGSDCKYKDFFFIYHVNPVAQNKQEKNITPTLSNEKFITDNKNGTYDLTLTGQVKKQQTKQKLDVLFVYDNTAVMATDFGFNEKANKLSEGNYVSRNARKSEKVKAELKKFMGKLSNADCDVRYALVTMDGDKGYHGPSIKGKYSDDLTYRNNNDGKIKINQFKLGADPNEKALNIVGDFKGKKGGTPAWLSEAEDDGGKSDGFNITDEAYNDTKHVQGFTDNPQDIMSTLNSLDETQSTFAPGVGTTVISGENYASAMKNVKALMGQGDYEGPSSGRINSGSKVRSDAEKIVVFIAGGNPKFATINQDGVYDDTQRDNATDYYMIRRNYTKGWSYGNGYSINFAALNQARGELSQLSNVDAFYSIGVGNSDNWKYLNDFAMGQAYNSDGKHIKVTEPNREGYMDDYWMHPDRREKALADGVQYKFYGATSPASLSDAFRGIYQRVSRNGVQNVEITDILTKYVQPVPQNNSALTGQLVKMRDNGVEVDHVLSKAEQEAMDLEGFEVNATKNYSSEYGRDVWTLTLKTKPADFSLPAGYDIRLVAKVEPTQDAKDFLKNNPTYPNVGEERTDLNDIFTRDLHRSYVDPNGESLEKFNTSAGKPGLFTNEKAEITHKVRKPDGSEVTPPAQKYYKPIIKVNKADLKIEKTFIGLDKELVNNSSGVTEFGKKIVQQLKFDILRSENKSGTNPANSFLTINFEEAPWADALNDPEVSRNGKKVPVTIDGENHEVTIQLINEANGKPKLSITVNNLDSEKYDYHVWEYINGLESNKAKAVLDPDNPGTQYRYIGGGGPNGPKSIDNTACGIFKFQNSYQKEQPKKTVTIKKIVQEFGGTAYSQEALNKKFNFFIALYRYNGSEYVPLSFEECQTIVNKWKSDYPTGDARIGGIRGPISVPIGDNKTVLQYLPRVSLKHGESISLKLDNDMYYRIFESKDEGYEVAKAVVNDSGRELPITIKEVHINEDDYSITEIMDQGKEFTFKNPRITLVPTGLRGDITPYLFSIFGFTMMAGMYLTIRKRKRVEI